MSDLYREGKYWGRVAMEKLAANQKPKRSQWPWAVISIFIIAALVFAVVVNI